MSLVYPTYLSTPISFTLSKYVFLVSSRFLFTKSYIIDVDVSSGNSSITSSYESIFFSVSFFSNIYVYYILIFGLYWYFSYFINYFCIIFLNKIISDAILVLIIYKILHKNWWCFIWAFVYYLILLHHIGGCDIGECCFSPSSYRPMASCFPIIVFCYFLRNCHILFIFLW